MNKITNGLNYIPSKVIDKFIYNTTSGIELNNTITNRFIKKTNQEDPFEWNYEENNKKNEENISESNDSTNTEIKSNYHENNQNTITDNEKTEENIQSDEESSDDFSDLYERFAELKELDKIRFPELEERDENTVEEPVKLSEEEFKNKFNTLAKEIINDIEESPQNPTSNNLKASLIKIIVTENIIHKKENPYNKSTKIFENSKKIENRIIKIKNTDNNVTTESEENLFSKNSLPINTNTQINQTKIIKPKFELKKFHDTLTNHLKKSPIIKQDEDKSFFFKKGEYDVSDFILNSIGRYFKMTVSSLVFGKTKQNPERIEKYQKHICKNIGFSIEKLNEPTPIKDLSLEDTDTLWRQAYINAAKDVMETVSELTPNAVFFNYAILILYLSYSNEDPKENSFEEYRTEFMKAMSEKGTILDKVINKTAKNIR